jgi:photosystem II stability/assembly factor-like uncharacterized protein
VNLYKSTDGGEHWFLAVAGPGGASSSANAPAADPRPLGRIGGGDLPTIAVDPHDPDVVYSSSTVLWRTEDGGRTWSAVRGAPGGDDYQKTWINPNRSNILLVVSDQGGVVSANRGVSWSNWYTQPTAAMYHVTTDNAFPYRVCGGQQDAGSACVDSRSMDGEITFHDWHPVNIQEYGIAAPDPHDPDLVYGSMRNNVSLYNRRTGTTTLLGPDLTGAGGPVRPTTAAKAPGAEVPRANATAAAAPAPPTGPGPYNRNVRTMPIAWSPIDLTTLYYTSDAVWKTADRGHDWTRISPDLARDTWTVPASAGKYASTVTPGPQGAVTALSLSPIRAGVMWAGTDDGNLQMTTDGGATWHNVTPAAIKPWTRIFNIDAGRFDPLTAYAAANTYRIDDLNPHFWRTHDGGKTWTEINTGIAPGAVSNSIREDPRAKGLLYAATNTEVWVSFDDGDHWSSLRLNMPAVSVRDIQVKDDTICRCADLVAGTHGRGFWILDDVTPLRQEAAARAASSAYLYRPEPAVRVRFGTNDPTPWPPELPAGENPPPGGIIDYYLASPASGPVRIEILDAAAQVVRTYASTDPVMHPDPALDSVAYNQLCQRTPTAPDCALPLYWPAPPMTVGTAPGMHRISWDLRYQPIPGVTPPGGDEAAIGAVPHRTYPASNAPWAPAGNYTVRLTVDGKQYTQPLRLYLDPRVHTSAAGLAALATLSKAAYDAANRAHAAYVEARALREHLDTAQAGNAALAARIDSIAPPPPPRAAFNPFGPPPSGPPTLQSITNSLVGVVSTLSRAEVAPTAKDSEAVRHAQAQLTAVMTRWDAVKRAARGATR